VIVHYFDVVCLVVPPDEADSPPIVDPDAVLSGSVSLKRFELIARRHAKVPQPAGGIQVEQFAPRDTFDGPEPGHDLVPKKRLGLATSK